MRADAHEHRPAFLAELCPGFILESAACAVHTPPFLEPTRHSLLQLRQQRLGLLQVGGVKAFGEPGIDGRQQLPSFCALALALPQATQAHRRAQLPRLRTLALSKVDSLMTTSFSLILHRQSQQELPMEPIQLRLVETLPGFMHYG